MYRRNQDAHDCNPRSPSLPFKLKKKKTVELSLKFLKTHVLVGSFTQFSQFILFKVLEIPISLNGSVSV